MSTTGERLAGLASELERSDRRLVTALLAAGLVATLVGLVRRSVGAAAASAADTWIVSLLAATMAAGLVALARRPDRTTTVRRIVSAGVVTYMVVRFASLLFFHDAAFGPPRGFALWLAVGHFLVYMNLSKNVALRCSFGLVGLQVVLTVLAGASGVRLSPPLRTWMAQLFLSQAAVVLLLHFFTLRQEWLARTTAWAERLEALAHTDHLTGLANRRALEEALEREVARVDRGSAAFAVVLLDLDRFKSVNDDRGHGAGDRVLEGVADRLAGALRRGDLAGRFGGEEFLVLAVDVDRSGALAVAERLLARVRAPGLLEDEAVTASAGVALHRAGETVESLLRRADEALYRAKSAGRDRAVAAS